MLNVFKRQQLPDDRLAAVCSGSDGVSVASVHHAPGVAPVLDYCAWQPSEEARHLRGLVKTRRLQHARGVTLMEQGSYQLLYVDAPPVEPSEMNAAIRWQIKDLVEFDVKDAIIDVFDAPARRSAGQTQQVYVVVAPRDAVKWQVEKVVAAGVQLDIIDIPELALRNIARLLPEDVGGAAVVYIGSKAGIVNITHRGILYLSRDVEFGTEALPQTAIHGDDTDTMNRWLDSIIIEVQRSLDYYESHYGQARVSGLVVMPMETAIPDMPAYLGDQLGLPARILDVNEVLDAGEEPDRETQAHCILAIGAALRQEAEDDAPAN